MKIFIDAQVMQFHFTGVAKITEKMYEQSLLNKNAEIIAICRGEIKGRLSSNIKIKKFSKFIPEFVWREVVFPMYLNLQKPSVIHFPWNGNIPFLLKKSHKVVTTLCDILPLEIPNYFQNPNQKRKYIRKIQRTIDRTDVLITISEYSKEQIVSNFITTIPPVVLALDSTLPVIKVKKPLVKKDYLYVGGYDSRKGLVNLITVFRNLKKKNLVSGQLIMVGRVNYFSLKFKSQIEEAVKEGCIVEQGYLNDKDLSILYQNSKALIYPSKYEGFGLPPLEAMYHGCPVLTTSFSSIPEVCGSAAMYFDPDKCDDFSKTILQFENNSALSNKMIEKGRLQTKKFSWSDTAEQFFKLII